MNCNKNKSNIPFGKYLVGIALVASLLGVTTTSQATPIELVVNGEFEVNVLAPGFGNAIPDASVPGWSCSSGVCELWVQGLAGSPVLGSDGFATGNHHELNASTGAQTTSQIIGPLASAAIADFTFDMWNGGGGIIWSVTGSISGVLSSGTVLGSASAWTATTATGLSIAAGESITLSFTSQTTSSVSSNIDGVSLLATTVPEPSTLALLALGIVGIGARRRQID